MTDSRALVEAIDAQLPQTQCRKCGFQGCRPYAVALAEGTTAINRCPPGGSDGIARLAALLGTPVLPLDPDCGVEAPLKLALIAEDACIGCTLCIQACPVDAIVGAPKRMHTVLLAHCTGCELCLPPCPVDCIDMIDAQALAERGARGAQMRLALNPAAARDVSRQRHLQHQAQRARLASRNDARLARKARENLAGLSNTDPESARKRETVMRALARARQRRATP